MLYTAEISSPLGPLTLAGDGEHLCGLWLEQQKYYMSTLPEDYRKDADIPVFRDTADWLKRYFAGEQVSHLDLPLAPPGTPFRRKVWRRIADIPYGSTLSYRELAEEMDSTPRAIGGAVGHNPISIIIPCHRVIGSDGSLVGYAGGLEAKKFLLKLEGVVLPEIESQ